MAKKKIHPDKPKAQLVAIDLIKVPRRLQRTLNRGVLDEIDNKWDVDLLGTIEACRRDGKYITIDGQHRHTVARRKGLTHMWVDVQPPMTDEQIAAAILNRNTARAPINAMDRYKLNHTAGDELTQECQKTVESCSFKTLVNAHSNKTMILATTQLISMTKTGTIEQVLLTIGGAWPGDPTGPQASILKGLSAFFLKSNFNDVGSEDRLEKKLASKNPDQLAATGRMRADADGVSIAIGTARAIMSLYNGGKGRGRPAVGKSKIRMDFG